MPSDLTERFDRFRREPLATVLADPEALRQEGTRRRRIRRAATAGLAAVAVAALAVTLTSVLPTPLGIPPPPPGIIASSTPAATEPTPTRTTREPTPTPTPSATGSAEPTSLIPDTAFSDDSQLLFEDRADPLFPEFCGALSVETPDLLARRSRGSYIDVPDPPDQPAPEGYFDVQILLYTDGGASRFMESLRAAVATCRTDANWMEGMYGPLSLSAAAEEGPVYGDETFVFIASHEDPLSPSSTETYTCEDLYEVVRVGDAVHMADVDGWETCYADPELDRQLRDSSIDAFVAWALTL
jgi:hypothetical protein